jgi:hypothetical protein
MRLGTFVIITTLVFLVGGVIVFIHMSLTTPGELIPTQGYVVMGVGTLAGVTVWTILISFLFYGAGQDRTTIAACSRADKTNGFADFNGVFAEAQAEANCGSLQAHQNANPRFDLAFLRTSGGADVAVLRVADGIEAVRVYLPYQSRASRS